MKFFKLKNNKGFTLLELLIVFGLAIFLVSGLIFYSRTAEQQLILYKERAKVLSSLEKAKYLAISTYVDSTVVCGYGAHFDQINNSIIIFRKMPIGGGCTAIEYSYTASDQRFEDEIFLDKLVEFSGLGATDVIFIPPFPKTYIDAGSKTEALITIFTPKTNQSSTIKITDAGQITIQ